MTREQQTLSLFQKEKLLENLVAISVLLALLVLPTFVTLPNPQRAVTSIVFGRKNFIRHPFPKSGMSRSIVVPVSRYRSLLLSLLLIILFDKHPSNPTSILNDHHILTLRGLDRTPSPR